jgi:hypothetical protein
MVSVIVACLDGRVAPGRSVAGCGLGARDSGLGGCESRSAEFCFVFSFWDCFVFWRFLLLELREGMDDHIADNSSEFWVRRISMSGRFWTLFDRYPRVMVFFMSFLSTCRLHSLLRRS